MQVSVLIPMCLAVLMVQLDTTIVSLGTHAVGEAFHAPTSAMQWVVDAYNLTYASVIVVGGAISDRFGRKRVFLCGVAIFTVGCLACALAPTMPMLLAARAFAGIGAGLALPGSLSILADAHSDPAARGRAIAIWAGINGIAIGIGPTAGGALIAAFGWRSMFFVTVPVGIAAFAMAAAWVRAATGTRTIGISVPNIVAAISVLACFAYGAIQHSNAAFLGAVAAAAAFVLLERRTGAPLVGASFLRTKRFIASVVTAVCMTSGMYAFLFSVPRYTQSVMHAGALQTGIALLPLGVVFAVLSPFAGSLAQRFGERTVIVVGMFACGTALLGSVLLAQSHALALLAVASAFAGLGLGLATGPLMNLGVSAIPQERSGMASALINTGRMVGATLGVATLGGAIMQRGMLAGGIIEWIGAAVAYAFAKT